jgi:hypothetical protein
LNTTRTKTSNWVFRISLSLLIFGTVRHGQFMYDQVHPMIDSGTGPVYWTALVSVMNGTVSLAAAVLAMLLRSGAVVWLLGLQLAFTFLTLLPSLLSIDDTAPALIGVAIAGAALLAGAVIFTYLIRRNEIRIP